MAQTPDKELVARQIGLIDFFVLLGGSLVGKAVATVDTLGPVNVVIGIPVGAISAHYLKNLRLKEFLMGFGIGMVDGGLDTVSSNVARSIDKELAKSNIKTLNRSVDEAIRGAFRQAPLITPTPTPTPTGVDILGEQYSSPGAQMEGAWIPTDGGFDFYLGPGRWEYGMDIL